MLAINCPQGSDQWHKERAGCITASMFEVARAKLKSGKSKGEPTSAALDYAFLLAIERISREPLKEGYETWEMRRGHELEPDARMAHEIRTGLVVKQVGLVKTDDLAFGASADGFIGDDGVSEYKCFLAPSKLRAFHIDHDAGSIKDQVQGVLWITGRKWAHIGMYCPALKSVGRELWLGEYERDDEYIEELEADLWKFKLLVDEYEARLRDKAA